MKVNYSVINPWSGYSEATEMSKIVSIEDIQHRNKTVRICKDKERRILLIVDVLDIARWEIFPD